MTGYGDSMPVKQSFFIDQPEAGLKPETRHPSGPEAETSTRGKK
jgi:hypothetical protein